MALGEFEGRDLDEAIRIAVAELGIDDADLHYEIVEQGRKGILGLGARSVRIRIMPPVEGLEADDLRVRPAPEPEPARESRQEPRAEAPRDGEPGGREVATVLERIVELAGLEISIAPSAEGSEVTLSLEGRDRKLLTQRNAELLHALQFLLNRMARRAWPQVTRVRLRADGDREARDERDDALLERARDIIRQVVDTGRPRQTGPMNAYERRLVHLAVREVPGLVSRSEGAGSLKRVRILKSRP